MNIVTIINQIAIFFLLIFIGYILARKNIINEQGNAALNSLLINIFMPSMIIASMRIEFSPKTLIESVYAIILGILVAFLSILIAKIYNIFNKNDENKGIYEFALIFSNAGFMGFPIVQGTLGDKALFYASFFSIPFSILTFTYGIFLLSSNEDKNLKNTNLKMFVNPPNVAVIIGIILFILRIKMPYAIDKTVSLLASSTVPISMLYIGSVLSSISIKSIFNNIKIYHIAIIRLIILPILVFCVFKYFVFNKLLISSITLITAMPVAGNLAALSERFGKDAVLGSKSIFVSTMLSVLTIPIIILITAM